MSFTTSSRGEGAVAFADIEVEPSGVAETELFVLDAAPVLDVVEDWSSSSRERELALS